MIADAIASVHRRITRAAERASRDASGVRLLAVTKTVPAAVVEEAIRAGAAELGENRVQEALAKQAEVNLAASWQLIGHLQTNKARAAANAFDAVHSVDSVRVAEALSRNRSPASEPLMVLIEVELTAIPGRTGSSRGEVADLATTITSLPRLHLTGLMTVAPMGRDPEAARGCFASLRELRDKLQQQLGRSLPELSMGMSDDFEVAIQEGATVVRLGRALFGSRL